jgi:hypothetical protein
MRYFKRAFLPGQSRSARPITVALVLLLDLAGPLAILVVDK